VLSLVLDETFATNDLGWPDDPDSMAWFASDGYHLATRNPGHFVAVAPAERLGLSALQVTATFRKVAGVSGGSYGIIVHDQGHGRLDGLNQTGDFDVLEARDTGEVSIWRNEGDRRVELVHWRTTPAVRVGAEENQLLVRAIGTQLLLLINGVEAARSVDPTMDSGGVGVFVGGESNEAVLRRFVVEAVS
jgi:hypothetical protein